MSVLKHPAHAPRPGMAKSIAKPMKPLTSNHPGTKGPTQVKHSFGTKATPGKAGPHSKPR